MSGAPPKKPVGGYSPTPAPSATEAQEIAYLRGMARVAASRGCKAQSLDFTRQADELEAKAKAPAPDTGLRAPARWG
jgi:hypothetical protein